MTVVPNELPSDDLTEYSYEALEQLQGEDVFESTGYAVADKEELLKVPFIVTNVTFRQSDQNNVGYVSLEATTHKNERVVINDGSTGIFKQIVHLAVTRNIFKPEADTALADDVSLADLVSPNAPDDRVNIWLSTEGEWNIEWRLGLLKCKRGLRKSEYGAREIAGKKIPAGTTFYIA